MNNRLIAAIIMCYICAVLFWINTGQWIGSAIIIVISSISIKLHFKAKARPFVYICGYLLLALFFAVKYQLTLFQNERALLVEDDLLLNFCQFLMFATVLSLMVRQSGHIGSWFAVCCIVIMVFLDKIDSSTGRLEYIFILLNAACAVVFWFSLETKAIYTGTKRVKNAVVLAVMVLAVYANYLHSDTLYKQYRSSINCFSINGAILGEAYGDRKSTSGFSIESNEISRGKIETAGNERIVAHVFSDVCPKYLIGKIYDQYSNGKWNSKDEYDLLLADKRFTNKDNRGTFVFDQQAIENKGEVFEIHHLQYFDGVIFTVPNTVAVSIDAESLLCNEWGDILSHNSKSKSYKVYSSDAKHQQGPSDDVASLLTVTPDEIRDELGAIAERIFAEHDTTIKKILALYKFWQDAKHTFDVDIPIGCEPVVYLVKNKPDAHCELYASAACMLLRLGGIPTRYATGFAVTGHQDGYWIVQNKDAHAWAQAWDAEGSRWVDVDIAARPNNSIATGAVSQGNTLSMQQRFKAAWFNCGFKGIAKLSVTLACDFFKKTAARLAWWGTIVIVAGFIAAIALYKVCLSRHRAMKNDTAVNKMQKQLCEMDKLIQNRGLTRKLSETTVRFAERLAEHGPCYDGRNGHISWYKRYSQIRYSSRVE